MGISDDSTNVPSFMKNPGWEALQEEIRLGQRAGLSEMQTRLDEVKAQVAAAEVESGISALGTPAPKEELFVLRRKFHRHASLEWLIEKPLVKGEVDEVIALWSKLGSQPMLDKGAFISLAEVEEMEQRREKGQIEVIKRLMQSPKISFGPTTKLPGVSSLGSPLDNGDEQAFVLSKWFFGANPRYKDYFFGMIFSENDTVRLVWLFDEVKPQSFTSVAKLKEALGRRLAGRTAEGSHGTIGDRLGGLDEQPRFQGHPNRHTAGSPTKGAELKSAGKPKAEPPEPEAEDDSVLEPKAPATGPAVEAVHVEGNGSSSIGAVVGSDAVEAVKEAVARRPRAATKK